MGRTVPLKRNPSCQHCKALLHVLYGRQRLAMGGWGTLAHLNCEKLTSTNPLAIKLGCGFMRALLLVGVAPRKAMPIGAVCHFLYRPDFVIFTLLT